MGGSVSSGRTNDELIDNLVESQHIKTEAVESVFRAVDRAIFYMASHRDVAYRDLAWREGNIHISAPCIYSEVMEALKIDEGLSFLNIGSGTGYLSTMVGLVLGSYGINHNIELHKDVVEYAKKCVSEFARTSAAFDEFNFCFPKFIHGNCLNMAIGDDTMLYDRIYVGAGVTSDQGEFIKRLLKVNGILVMPLEDLLVQVTRKSDSEYVTKPLMSVSFANLINEDIALNSISMPKANTLSLQELCRYRIRELLCDKIRDEHPDYYSFNSKLKDQDELSIRSNSVPYTTAGVSGSGSGTSSRPNASSAQSSQADGASETNSYIYRGLILNSSTDPQFRLMIHTPLLNNYENAESEDEVSGTENEEFSHGNEGNEADERKRSKASSADSGTSSLSVERGSNSNSVAQIQNHAISKIESTEFNRIVSNQSKSTSDNLATSSSISAHELAKNQTTRSKATTTAQTHGESAAAQRAAPVKSSLTSSRSDAMSLTVKELVERTIIKETSLCNTKPEALPKRINYLREKILQLCLPTTVKNYLLYNREI